MHRTPENLEIYKRSGQKVLDRAENLCEVMVDEDGNACTDKPKRRCCKWIATETVRYINFLHTGTRNGKSDEWINDPNNIVLGCESHHIEEERTGIRVQAVKYNNDELTYIPE